MSRSGAFGAAMPRPTRQPRSFPCRSVLGGVPAIHALPLAASGRRKGSTLLRYERNRQTPIGSPTVWPICSPKDDYTSFNSFGRMLFDLRSDDEMKKRLSVLPHNALKQANQTAESMSSAEEHCQDEFGPPPNALTAPMRSTNPLQLPWAQDERIDRAHEIVWTPSTGVVQRKVTSGGRAVLAALGAIFSSSSAANTAIASEKPGQKSVPET